MVALLLALFVQEATAEDAAAFLKRIEEKAASAKTLRWKSTANVAADKKEIKVTTHGAFKDGNKVSLKGEAKIGEETRTFSLTCDGAKAHSASGHDGAKTGDAAKTFAAALRLATLRTGLFCLNHPPDPDATDEQLAGIVTIESAAFQKNEKLGDREARVVSYKATVGGKTATITLWVDARTLAPIKRSMADNEVQIVETYDEWLVDGEIKDEEFALPKGK